MYFRLGVKTRREEFFNFEEQLKTFLRELKLPDTRMIVIKGIRRTGKSSLLRVGLELSNLPYVIIDVRSLGYLTPDNFYDMFAEALTELIKREKGVLSFLTRVRGLSISGVSVEFTERNRRTLYEVLREIEEWASRKHSFILAFDEAQDLRLIPGFEKLLAHIYDYRGGIKIVLTGSEVGVLDRLLGRANPSAPLYGRSFIEIIMGRLDRAKALEFLKLGFREQGLTPPEAELREAVSMLDGIIGWLTAYGYYRIREGHEEAMRKVVDEGSKLIKEELENFLSIRRVARIRYLTILRLLLKPLRWSEIKRGLQLEIGKKIADNILSRYLKELQDYGFIEKVDSKYMLTDPLISFALEKIK